VSSPRGERGDEPVLSVRGLSRTYTVGEGWFGRRRIDAVSSVDLDLYEGELVAVVGESGSGKTTLTRMIAGLVSPTSGVITHRGIELHKRTRKQMKDFRRNRSVVFQNPYLSLNPRMRVGKALEEALKVSGAVAKAERATEVDRLLASVGLRADYRTKFPLMLSGGERQRVAIARAISSRPDLLIADEVTSALDVSVSAHIVNLLLELKEARNFSCLFVTHDLSLALAIADRILIMRQGAVVDSGTPHELTHQSVHEYTRQLLDLVIEPTDSLVPASDQS
jgi:peptide/nickel transport system ATP-binding protein